MLWGFEKEESKQRVPGFHLESGAQLELLTENVAPKKWE
jgi:hypothetical protein